MTDIDRPDIVAQVRAAFERYEQALVTNDTAVLDELFWNDERSLRYGTHENLYGADAIRAFRQARPTGDLRRTLERISITTFGIACAAVNVEYRRTSSGRIGRQSQTWVRLAEGWRIVAAHVSLIPVEA